VKQSSNDFISEEKKQKILQEMLESSLEKDWAEML